MFRLYLLCVAFIICVQTSPAQAYVTILMYHKFDAADSPSTSISSRMFADQMKYLHTHDYAVLSMEELERCIKGKMPMPAKGVVITIDDGDISEYTKAIPILKRYDYPFCIYVFTRGVGAPGYMNWDQLREIRSIRGDVGCHTHTHPHLIDQSEEGIEEELFKSKKILEENLGREIRWFAYTFGEYDASVRAVASRAGFSLMLTSDPGSVGPHTLPDLVPRQAIVGRNMDMSRFIEKLSYPELNVLERSPWRGRLNGKVLAGVSITIDEPGLYYPGQVQMFLSEKGRLDTEYDPASGVLVFKGPIEITRKVNRIITTAKRKSDGLYAMDSYMIVLPDQALTDK